VVLIPGTIVGSDPAMGRGQHLDGGGPGLTGPQQSADGPYIPGPPEAGSDPSNPYQSPAAVPTFFPGGPCSPYDRPLERNGPPWEREGPSMGTFFGTIQQHYGQLSMFYSTMRCKGGWWLPLAFVWINHGLAELVYGSYNVAIGLIFGSMMDGGLTSNPFSVGSIQYSLVANVAIALVRVAVTPLAVLLSAAINHLFLMMLGGASRGFEATFRVVCYSVGAASPLFLIPCLGPLSSLISTMAFEITGLSRVHETTAWKAAMASLLPWFICCGVFVGFLALVPTIVEQFAR
jgi:hypothetical protein